MQLRLGAAMSVDALVDEALAILSEAKYQYRPVKTFVLLSGGNDSTTLTYVVRDHVDAAVHIRTGIGIPATTDHVRVVCQELHLPLIELVTPPDVYRSLVLGSRGSGFPGPAQHFITYHRLKARRLQELQRDYAKGRGATILLVSGVRSQESARRMLSVGAREHEPGRGRLMKCAWANPIVHWTSHELNEVRLAMGVRQSEVADLLHRSGECLCGAFARANELEEIGLWFPETAAYIRGLEMEAIALGKPMPRWGSGRGRGKREPGPLCSSCLFEMEQEPAG